MAYILNPEDENPLWRQYMDELGKMDSEEQSKWEYKIPFGFGISLSGTTVGQGGTVSVAYNQDSFLRMLETDEEFNKRWGKLRWEVRQEKIEEILVQRKQVD